MDVDELIAVMDQRASSYAGTIGPGQTTEFTLLGWVGDGYEHDDNTGLETPIDIAMIMPVEWQQPLDQPSGSPAAWPMFWPHMKELMEADGRIVAVRFYGATIVTTAEGTS